MGNQKCEVSRETTKEGVQSSASASIEGFWSHSISWVQLLVHLTPLRPLISSHHRLKGQCPDCAQARASSVFSLKDNRTVTLTPQDFLPDRTADGDLLFTFSSNILGFRRSFSSYLKFGSRHEASSRFCR